MAKLQVGMKITISTMESDNNYPWYGRVVTIKHINPNIIIVEQDEYDGVYTLPIAAIESGVVYVEDEDYMPPDGTGSVNVAYERYATFKENKRMNPIQAIDELIVKAQDALDLAEESMDADVVIDDIWKQEEALQALKLVRAMLPLAGHEEPDKPSASRAMLHATEAEYAALRVLRTAFVSGKNQKIKAIQAYRAHADVGLRDAKLAVEKLADKYGL